jgi:hypothetical protein
LFNSLDFVHPFHPAQKTYLTKFFSVKLSKIEAVSSLTIALVALIQIIASLEPMQFLGFVRWPLFPGLDPCLYRQIQRKSSLQGSHEAKMTK